MTIEGISPQVIAEINQRQAWHYRIVPFDAHGGTLSVYADGAAPLLHEELELLTGRQVQVQTIDPIEIDELLARYYPATREDLRQQNAYYSGQADDFLQHLIAEARALGSSDIHLEAFEEKCRVRVRIDGMLVQRYLLEKKQYSSLINKIKIIANLDIAEKRLPQDGRIFFEGGQEKFDIRVSVLPTLHGEKIVLRLLNSNAANIDIAALGFGEQALHHYLEGVRKPNGILLISGPTGSGKTTTLYATLKLLNKDMRNILTIEDPIEYTLEGINQVQLKENIGLSFAAALRTFLRQDPDIIMPGEIRDTETANMAIRAALTGHLVLSTIHTNSAWGIVSRLIDMGVAPYLLSNTLNTAVAQRLVRLLCPACRKKETLDPSLYPRGYKPPVKVEYHYTPVGCAACHNTGYKGRKAVYEVVAIDEELSERIKSADYNVRELLQQKGISSLSQNAFALFEKHCTSLDEVYTLLMN